MTTRRIERLRKVILRRAADVILYELHDPRLGFVTLSKVELSDDMRYAVIYYSVIGEDSDRSKTAHALETARGYVQKEIAHVLRTRVTPQIRFQYDDSVEGVLRISRIIDQAVAEDDATRRARGEEPGGDGPFDDDGTDDNTDDNTDDKTGDEPDGESRDGNEG